MTRSQPTGTRTLRRSRTGAALPGVATGAGEGAAEPELKDAKPKSDFGRTGWVPGASGREAGAKSPLSAATESNGTTKLASTAEISAKHAREELLRPIWNSAHGLAES